MSRRQQQEDRQSQSLPKQQQQQQRSTVVSNKQQQQQQDRRQDHPQQQSTQQRSVQFAPQQQTQQQQRQQQPQQQTQQPPQQQHQQQTVRHVYQQEHSSVAQDVNTKPSQTCSNPSDITNQHPYVHPVLQKNVKATFDDIAAARDEKRSFDQIVDQSPYMQFILNQHGDDLKHHQIHNPNAIPKPSPDVSFDPATSIDRRAGR